MTAVGDDDRSPLSGAGRTFRLFVSSTFSDLKAERDALQRRVFPALREHCEALGARFQAIDLRWGVSDEAGLDQKTMPLCLTEIERCQQTEKPNFLVLLGDRYGWRPLPATIPTDEFAQILGQIPGDEKQLLEEWYLRDDNAVPAEFYLKARRGDFVDQQSWEDLEKELREILLRAVDAAGFDPDRQVKYLASATEQEILVGALDVDDADQHVFCFFRTIDDLPHDQSSTAFEDLTKAGPEGPGWADFSPDVDARKHLEDLKGELAKKVGRGHVTTYPVHWAPFDRGGRSRAELLKIAQEERIEVPDGAPDEEIMVRLPGQAGTDHLDDFCRDVRESLRTVIDARFSEGTKTAPSDLEAGFHRRFGEQRAQSFEGRTGQLAAIDGYLTDPGGRLLVVSGPSGSGKSALMGEAVRSARKDYPSAQLVERYIGATAASSEGRQLLSGLCRQISDLYGDTSEVPADFRELVQEFPKRLELATADRPLLLFLDALDQLASGDAARSLTWLPRQPADHVAIVVSTLKGDTLTALQSRPSTTVVQVGPMERSDADRVLTTWLKDAKRTLQEDQRTEVLDGFDREGLPLYLKLAFEEARLWRSEGKHRRLADDVPELIRSNLFARLADRATHGPMLVYKSLGYLAASRYGLAEDELLTVLSRDEDLYTWVLKHAHHDLPATEEGEQQIPVVLWSRLYADLEPYLTTRQTEGATVLTFYHRQFGEVAHEVFVDVPDWSDEAAEDQTVGITLHARLADYFRSRAGQHSDEHGPTWTKDGTHVDLRGLSELPYHLTGAENWEGVEDVLTDFRFLERKVAEVGIVEQNDTDGNPTKLYTGVYQLRDDYDHALRVMGGQGDDPRHRIIVTAVDLGNGLEIRCPHCNRMIPWDEDYKGEEVPCPLEGCGGPLKVNPFVAGERA